MAKFHIRRDGTPGLCTATERPCPCGGPEAHYDSMQEAQEAADFQNMASFGGLTGHDSMQSGKYVSFRDFKTEMEDSKTMGAIAYQVSSKVEGVGGKGWKVECFCAAQFAEQLGCDSALIMNAHEGTTLYSNTSEEYDRDAFIKEVNQNLADYYRSIGYKIKKGDLARVIYHNADRSVIVAQSGAPNTLDAAIIDANGVHLVEIKQMHGDGSQMTNTVFGADENGSLTNVPEDLHPEVREALKDYNISQSRGTNYEVSVSQEAAAEHLVKTYQDKGSKYILYTNKDGRLVPFNIEGDTKVVAREMLDAGCSVNLVVRANAETKKATKADQQRFANELGKVNSEGKFKLDDLDWDKMAEGPKGRIRYGEYVIDHPYKDALRDKNFQFHVSELQCSQPHLTAVLKHGVEARKKERLEKQKKVERRG